MISLIAAKDKNNVIGDGSGMPWHIPDDLKHFKRLTYGNTVVMGRRTFESIGRPLPGRTNIILSGRLSIDDRFIADGSEKTKTHITIYRDWQLLLANMQRQKEEEFFVIGGGDIYRLFLPFAERLYLTEIHDTYRGCVTFPAFSPQQFIETGRVANSADRLHFDFVTYERSNPEK